MIEAENVEKEGAQRCIDKMSHGNGRKTNKKIVELRCEKITWVLQKEVKRMEFGEKLQKMRKANNLSQEQLAEKLNVSRQAVSKWEGGALPDVDNIVKISAFFDCSLDYLMSNQEEVKEEHETEPEHMMEHEKNRTVRKMPWDMKWILACMIPLSVLLILWTFANASDITLHIKDASSGMMYSKFLTYVADNNLYVYVYGSLVCLYTFVSIKCLYPIVQEKSRKQSLLRVILWLVYMIGILSVHNNLLNPRFFFSWSGWSVFFLIVYFGILFFLEARQIITNKLKGEN